MESYVRLRLVDHRGVLELICRMIGVDYRKGMSDQMRDSLEALCHEIRCQIHLNRFASYEDRMRDRHEPWVL